MNVRVEELDGKFTLAIPDDIAANLHLAEGSVVDISVREDGIMLRPVGVSRPTLDDMLAQVTDENRHEEIDFGPPVGREIW